MNVLPRLSAAFLGSMAMWFSHAPAYAQSDGAAASAAVGAQCQVSVTPSPPSWIILGHDPFSNDLAESTFNVTFTNQGGADCTFTPSFELAQPPYGLSKGSGARIRYSILNLTDSIDVTPRALRSNNRQVLREIVLQPRETRSILYRLVVDTDGIRAAGDFTQNLVITAQDRQLRTFGASPLVVGITVLPSARISLAGAYSISDGQAMADLGELRPGPAPVPLNLRVRSTGQYNLSVTSANSGRLRLGTSNWSIPYQMVIGGNPLNMRGSETISIDPGDGIRLNNLPIQFMIGDTTDRRAGRYSDTVSISISAL